LTTPLLEGIKEAVDADAGDVVLDAGCGEGFYLGTLTQKVGFTGCGIDISTAAIDAAATRYPKCEWIVGNADRLIPYTDQSFSIILSITGRMNSSEFHRVLKPKGCLLVAVASPEDLIELRGIGTDRVERTIATFAKDFKLVKTERVGTAADLDASGVEDVLHSIYRPLTDRPVEAMRVTFSLDLLLFETR
jgi:23S rRNA (guanine745-N1)-methyltransferase